MSKGQRAMVAALADPEPKPGKRTLLQNIEVGKDYLSRARLVLRYAPDLVDSVRDGITPLNIAYEEAQTARRASESADKLMADLRSRAERKLGELQRKQPKATGGDAQRTRFQKGTESPPTLTDLGITKKLSSRAQKLAARMPLPALQEARGEAGSPCGLSECGRALAGAGGAFH